MRICSRTACVGLAVATMTFVYSDSTAVLGPLSQEPEPGAYDLCPVHMERTSVPLGWQVIRIPLDGVALEQAAPSDDLMALAAAVRAIGMREDEPQARPTPRLVEPEPPLPGRHLRLVPTAD